MRVGAVTSVTTVEMLLPPAASVWSAVTSAELLTMVELCGVATMLMVAVAALAIVPNWQVTVFEACEQEPVLVDTETKASTEGRMSTTVTLVADAGPLLVTVRV